MWAEALVWTYWPAATSVKATRSDSFRVEVAMTVDIHVYGNIDIIA